MLTELSMMENPFSFCGSACEREADLLLMMDKTRSEDGVKDARRVRAA